MKKPRNPPKATEVLNSEKDIKKILEYMKSEKIKKFVKDMNERYFHWDEFIYRKIPKGTDRNLLWIMMKIVRNSSAKEIEIFKEKFSYNTYENIQVKLHEFDLNSGGNLQTPQNISPYDKEKYLISSIMEEAIASGQLEGASTTRKVAKEMLKTERKPRNESEYMILNNYVTAKMIKENKQKKLTNDFILKIHKSITKNTMDENLVGKYRKGSVSVVDNSNLENRYEPPKYNLIPDMMEGVCKFVNDRNSNFIHPIIKASILHFLIGYIHPFEDGNGRTARALFYWYLTKSNYWLIEFMSISRIIIESPAKYSRAYLYTETDENDLTYFIKFQIDTLDRALKTLKQYIDRKKKEKREIFELVKRTEEINDRQIYIIKDFYDDKRKTLTIKEVMVVFDVAYQTARSDLLDLEERGFLKKRTLGKKKLLFIRSDRFEDLVKK